MSIERVRQVFRLSYREYARLLVPAWRIYRFYRACGCSIRVAVSRAKLGRDPYQWLVDEQEKFRRAEALSLSNLARRPEDIPDEPRREWRASSHHRNVRS